MVSGWIPVLIQEPDMTRYSRSPLAVMTAIAITLTAIEVGCLAWLYRQPNGDMSLESAPVVKKRGKTLEQLKADNEYRHTMKYYALEKKRRLVK